jgi:4-hydroxy-tetrahydrodipicolinate synthase
VTSEATSGPLGCVLTAMVTPFAPDGSLDLATARRLARHLAESGSDGLVLSGTTGEGPTLTDEEKSALWSAIRDELGSTVVLLAGTGTYDTRHSVHLTRSAVACGMDGVLVVTPYYSKPPFEGILRHFEVVAEAAGELPVMVYNIPSRVVIELSGEQLSRLGEIPNVVAVKQAVNDPEIAAGIVADGKLALYAGNDEVFEPFLELGAAGGVLVASHVVGPQMRRLAELVAAGELEAARELDGRLRPIYAAMSLTANPIPVRAALALDGLDVGDARLPLVPASAEIRARLAEILATRPSLDAARGS